MIRQNSTNAVTNRKAIRSMSQVPKNKIVNHQRLALQIYSINKAEKTKKQPRLPINDVRRQVIHSKQQLPLSKKLQLKITADVIPVKKIVTTAFSLLQYKPNKI